MVKFFNCLTILFLIHFTISAQQNFAPAYIVEHNQDTVRGFIEIAMDADLMKSIKFKKEGNAQWKEFMPADLLGFGIEKEVYKNMRFLNTAEGSIQDNAFVKQLVSGEYNLYSFLKSDRKFFLLQKDTAIYFLYDRVTRNTGEIDQEGNYLNYLNLISVPCEKIANQFDRVGFNDKDMVNFIMNVDNCISKGKTTNFYQKPKYQIHPWVFAGGSPISGSSEFTANFILRFTLPKLDKKTSLNIGINYISTTEETTLRDNANNKYKKTTHTQIFSLPLTIQYNFTTTRVQPYFYGGFSGAYSIETINTMGVYNPNLSNNQFDLALVAGIGIDVRIISGLFLKADWRYESFIQYPVIGIAYQF